MKRMEDIKNSTHVYTTAKKCPEGDSDEKLSEESDREQKTQLLHRGFSTDQSGSRA